MDIASAKSEDVVTPEEELIALRERVQCLEQERFEQAKRANAAIVAAQERAYWLDRWHLDLNRIMAGRWASRARATFRVFRTPVRKYRQVKRTLQS